jgi:hypothetical protein
MKTYQKLFFGVGCLVSLVGCTSYPLGLTKSEWEALTPAKQAEYRKLQSQKSAEEQTAADVQRANDESERRAIEQSLRASPLK